ncbi:MAG: hypothetical protein EOP05_04305 [Proteobacteria bacterium]|nr:MAG: hypothetical protein EOP05_04305 [Pseudomonadota bacterium]
MDLEDEKLIKVGRVGADALKRDRTGRLVREKKFTRAVLTSRDFDVLKFVLEMRFATREELFRRFFKVTQAGTIATSPEFMRRRLIELEKLSLLIRTKNYISGVQCFVATDKTQKLLQEKYPDAFFPRAIKQIHWVNFFHDELVLKSRIEFEAELRITDWISDHSLKTLGPKLFGLKMKYAPDGVYRLPSGEWRAFELENSKKEKRIYREKLELYAKLIKTRSEMPGMFTKVHIRCTSLLLNTIQKIKIDQFLVRNPGLNR